MSRACHLQPYTHPEETVARALEAVDAAALLAGQPLLVIKPNLVNASPPPVTLPVALTEALVRWLRTATDAEIVIAEGTGDRHLSTFDVYEALGYRALAERWELRLLDLNQAPLVRLERPEYEVFPEFWLPEILQRAFVVSFAVLKAHSLAEVTLSMKNMIGCAPPSHYQQGGHWKKSTFHRRMQRSIFELNRYRAPDLALIDASVGLADYHLGGAACSPPPERLIAGSDPVAVDAAGAALLGRDWRRIDHIRWADGILGTAELGEAALSA